MLAWSAFSAFNSFQQGKAKARRPVLTHYCKFERVLFKCQAVGLQRSMSSTCGSRVHDIPKHCPSLAPTLQSSSPSKEDPLEPQITNQICCSSPFPRTTVVHPSGEPESSSLSSPTLPCCLCSKTIGGSSHAISFQVQNRFAQQGSSQPKSLLPSKLQPQLEDHLPWAGCFAIEILFSQIISMKSVACTERKRT